MNPSSFPEYYHPYIEKIPEDKDPLELLNIVLKETIKTLAMVPEDKANESYAPGKWSIKEVVQHLIDTERIYCYRALAFARGESIKIPGYDHNQYAAVSDANRRSLKSLLEELKIVRNSTLLLFLSFTEEMMQKKGNANGVDITAEKILWILIGHELHHLYILEERYL